MLVARMTEGVTVAARKVEARLEALKVQALQKWTKETASTLRNLERILVVCFPPFLCISLLVLIAISNLFPCFDCLSILWSILSEVKAVKAQQHSCLNSRQSNKSNTSNWSMTSVSPRHNDFFKLADAKFYINR